jgi:hypothetical protein
MAGERHFGLGIEATWGTPAPMDIWLELLSEGLQLEPAYQEIQTIRTRSTRAMPLLGDVVRGPATVLVNYQDIAHLFFYLLGSEDFQVDTPSVGLGTHTLPASTGLVARPPLTAEVQRDEGTTGDTWQYAGNILTALNLSIALEQAMQAEINLVGATEANAAAGTPSYPDLDVVIPSHVTVNVDAAAQEARTFNLQCAYPVDEPRKLGSTAIAKQPDDSGVLAVAGDFEVYFDSMTEYNKFAAHTTVDVQCVADSGGDETLTINCNQCKLLQGTPHIDARNRIMAPFSFSSFFDTVATENLQAIVVNDVNAALDA